MQPDVNVTDMESVYTEDQTLASSQTKDGGDHRNLKTVSADDIKFVQNRFPRLIPNAPPRHIGTSDYRTVLNSTMTASSVGTQSLIANESIPDALPSTEVSNVTMLDIGSITTLDPGESLGKSAGLFASSNSKNLDISTVVSPVRIPSGDLTSRDNMITSAIPEGSIEHSCSIASSAEFGGLAVTTAGGNGGEEEARESSGKGKKAMEVNWESMDRSRLFDDKYSTAETSRLDVDQPVLPQSVTLVISESGSPSGEAARCTDHTHKTAAPAEGTSTDHLVHTLR